VLLSEAAVDASFGGVERRALIEWTCYLALNRGEDERAAEWLERAHSNLRAKAEAIGDVSLRELFLNNVPEHREIVASWQAWLSERAATSNSG
jgi:hypothetical protein